MGLPVHKRLLQNVMQDEQSYVVQNVLEWNYCYRDASFLSGVACPLKTINLCQLKKIVLVMKAERY